MTTNGQQSLASSTPSAESLLQAIRYYLPAKLDGGISCIERYARELDAAQGCASDAGAGSASASASRAQTEQRHELAREVKSVVTDADVERVARAICEARDLTPDTLYQHFDGEGWPNDHTDQQGRLFHYAWRKHCKVAQAAIAAILNATHRDAREVCMSCGGTGKPVSGLPCICGGTGRLIDAAIAMTARIFDLERAQSPVIESGSDAKVEADAARYRWLRDRDGELTVCDEDTSYFGHYLDAVLDKQLAYSELDPAQPPDRGRQFADDKQAAGANSRTTEGPEP